MVTQTNVHKLFRTALAIFKPKDELSVSEWSDRYRVLPPTASSQSGKWKTSRFPFLKDIMDSLGQSSQYAETVFMKGSQIGGTESLLNCIFYYIHQKPQSVLSVQPTIGIAETYSKQRIQPSILASPTIANCVTLKALKGGGGSTILQKQYRGGMLILAGANSAAGLRSMPIGVLMLDEVDGYPLDVDGEGDPVALALRRTTNFPKRRIFYNSTPTDKSTSRVEPLFNNSTQRHYKMPCPHCSELMEFTWENMHWDKDKDNKLVKPIHAYQVCPICGSVIESLHKTKMMAEGMWVADNEDATINGFYLNALYSPVGFYSWESAVDDWHRSQGDRDKLKTFINTVLAQTWEDTNNAIEHGSLLSRCEEYGSKVPNDVLVLTCGVDVQPDRLELEVVGWGDLYESWGIEYRVFYGDTNELDVWEVLDTYLQQPFKRTDGHNMYIMGTAIDSGDGNSVDRVYAFCVGKEFRYVFPIKGKGGIGVPIVGKPTKNRLNGTLFVLGVDSLKDNTYYRLGKSTPGAGYCHFPIAYTEEYFKQLTSEKKVYIFRSGVKSIKWKKIRDRNEALDIRNYARAILEVLQPDWNVLKETGAVLRNPNETAKMKQQHSGVSIYD